jgi:hypothetical protein
MLTFRVCNNVVTVEDGDKLIITRVLEKQYTISWTYDGTVSGMAKAVNTVAELSDTDFKMFADISKVELEELDEL